MLCTDGISDFLPSGRLLSLANFTAEPGKIDYFRARTTGGRAGLGDRGSQVATDMEPVNSDEGKLLAAFSELSVPHLQN